MIKTDFADRLTATQRMRVPFHDIDPAGVAWHGRYFKYFEGARSALLEDLGYSYEAMTESGYLWPIVDATVRFVKPLTLNQSFRVTACLREWEMRLVIDYLIEDEEGTVHTRARTVQVPVDAKTMELSLGSPRVLVDTVERRMRSRGR